jgi:DNA-binding transcriptional LysR family regulator
MSREIELRHYRYFLAVSETLHFGRAAERLGMSQPPLSHQIKELERSLGYALFDRTTRGARLTSVGQFFLERVRTTLARVGDDVELARRVGRGQEGVLTIGFSGSTMFTALPKAIGRYRRMYPMVEFRLRELTTGEQLPALLNGTLDLGFLRDGEAREGLTLEPILREPFLAVLPSRHRLAEKAVISPAQLKDEPFVLFARKMGNLAYDRTVTCCEADGFRPRIVQDAPQWPTVLQLVAAGLGVSLAPACVAKIRASGVVFKRVRSQHWTSVDIGMRSKLDNPTVEPFLKIARQQFAVI